MPPHQEMLPPDTLCLQLVCLLGPFSWTQYLRTSRTEFLILTSQITSLVKTSVTKFHTKRIQWWHPRAKGHRWTSLWHQNCFSGHYSAAQEQKQIVWPDAELCLHCLCPSSVLLGGACVWSINIFGFIEAFLATSSLEASFPTQNSVAVQIFGSRGLSWHTLTQHCESGRTWLWASTWPVSSAVRQQGGFLAWSLQTGCEAGGPFICLWCYPSPSISPGSSN